MEKGNFMKFNSKINIGAIRFLSIALGVLLLFHGIDKLIHGTWLVYKLLHDAGIPFSNYLRYGVYLSEIIAPIFLIFGQFIKIAGAIITFNMLVAILLAYNSKIFSLGEHGGWAIELPLLYMIAGITIFLSKE
jgi:putative oxidoreductase